MNEYFLFLYEHIYKVPEEIQYIPIMAWVIGVYFLSKPIAFHRKQKQLLLLKSSQEMQIIIYQANWRIFVLASFLIILSAFCMMLTGQESARAVAIGCMSLFYFKVCGDIVSRCIVNRAIDLANTPKGIGACWCIH